MPPRHLPPAQQVPRITWSDIAKISVVAGPFFVAGAGFYFNTNSRLNEHDRQFIEFRSDMAAAKQKTQNIGETDRAEREKSRNEFLARTEKMSDGIAELNKRTAVQETLAATMSNTLTKISDQLSRISPPSGRSR